MKVTNEDYATLRDAIGVDLRPNASERERWDALWRAVDSGRLSYEWFRPYMDDHVDTALRKVAGESA